MKNWPWGLFTLSAGLVTGCGEPMRGGSVPPIDLTAPTVTQTATFALG
jgi:hypothetical protein